jgi:hypothetical protein
MAVAMKQRFARELRQGCIGPYFLLQEFAEQEGLAAKGLGALVIGKEVREFVPKHGDAAGLESDDGDAGFDLGLELVQDVEEEFLGAVEHAEVVKGPSAAEVRARDQDAEARGFKDFDRGARGRGKKVIVEGVGPKQNGGD